MRSIHGRLRVLTFVASFLPGLLFADDVVTIAVASNFARTAEAVSTAFTQESGVPVRTTHGSTGKLYAQIIHGAPFDVFLSADSDRPLLLEQAGLIVNGSRRTYATGSLVLWSQDEIMRGKDCRAVLEKSAFGRLALANPETAPYGSAAREFLNGAGLWEKASVRAVYGESIAQTLQFVATGNATLGFVAKSQTTNPALPAGTCSWPVPVSTHAPLHQQAVVLKRAGANDGARRFADFLQTSAAKKIIREHGYQVSD